ncbi:hypothetical protein X801_06701 [Opisthorchis viverrini]|uniref:Uncharacterized protein n=1 Tax=Opisthorchis viverrini TaxID=6198 RepID=A0A1S8WSG7_OPIVI|nr:hypothetical protein X801_06701 [Opisthorchis viverrini]
MLTYSIIVPQHHESEGTSLTLSAKLQFNQVSGGRALSN